MTFYGQERVDLRGKGRGQPVQIPVTAQGEPTNQRAAIVSQQSRALTVTGKPAFDPREIAAREAIPDPERHEQDGRDIAQSNRLAYERTRATGLDPIRHPRHFARHMLQERGVVSSESDGARRYPELAN